MPEVCISEIGLTFYLKFSDAKANLNYPGKLRSTALAILTSKHVVLSIAGGGIEASFRD